MAPLPHQSQHDVTFYQYEAPLIEELVQFVGEGLLAKEAVLVVATPAHITALRAALESVAIDVERAEETRHLTFADAEALLATFMVDGRPDTDLFHRHVGRQLQQMRADTDPKMRLRVFGEMVDLLWGSGNFDAAIRLEDLWNELAAGTGLSLLCAYHMDNLFKERLLPRFQSLCIRHDRVV
jgi:hypothetical protein